MEIPEILWQNIVEKEFISFVSHNFASSPETAPSQQGVNRQLTDTEKNAVRYTVGYVMRKLEEKYPKQKSMTTLQRMSAFQVMASKQGTMKMQHY